MSILLWLAAAYAAIAGLGLWASRRTASGSLTDLVLAGRRLPLGVGVLTMTATWVGGGYVNGTAEAAYASGWLHVQAPWGYGLSLIVGGIWFAAPMRRRRFTTLLDPLDDRFGRAAAGALYLPALVGEVFWTGAILTALGTTFGVIVDVDFATAIVLSAAVAIGYTMVGGLWAVAMTDVAQVLLLVVGLAVVVPVAAASVGGLGEVLDAYRAEAVASSAAVNWWAWWDSALLLIFGGIPWHVYFQRVLAARDAATARQLSILAGVLCMVAAIPPLLLGTVARVTDWAAMGLVPPEPALVLPAVLRHLTDPTIAAVGLVALAAAVMSSVDSSILSASSMAAWNVYRPFVRPGAAPAELSRVIRRLIVFVGATGTVLALRVQSVYALWFLSSDLVYCLLFPQLVAALFDPRANRYGSFAGLGVALVIRIACGEPQLGIPPLVPLPTSAADGSALLPFRTLAMLAGLITIAVVSRASGGMCPPRRLRGES